MVVPKMLATLSRRLEQSNNTAMLVPNTNTRARCTGDDESAPKTRDSTLLLTTYLSALT